MRDKSDELRFVKVFQYRSQAADCTHTFPWDRYIIYCRTYILSQVENNKLGFHTDMVSDYCFTDISRMVILLNPTLVTRSVTLRTCVAEYNYYNYTYCIIILH